MPNENDHLALGNQGRGPSMPLEIEASELPEAIKVFQRYKALKRELATIHLSDAVSEQLRITAAQGAVIEFLQGDPEILASNIHKPLDDLHVALFELSCGGKPSILFEAQRPADVVTKQKTSYVHLAQGFLAAAFAALRQVGIKPAKARQWLDQELRRRHLLGQVAGKDLQGWYHQVNAGTAAEALIEAFHSCGADLARVTTIVQAERYAAWCLDTVARRELPRLKLRQSAD